VALVPQEQDKGLVAVEALAVLAVMVFLAFLVLAVQD
jgi:hypothetical protein